MFQKKVAQVLQERINLKDEKITLIKDELDQSDSLKNLYKRNKEDLELENESLKSQLFYKDKHLTFYKDLLSKPFSEIAEYNKDFEQTYKLQQELLADWIVSQKAFKQLSIDLGLELGKKPKDIIQQGMDKKIDVLENKNNPEYNTNGNQSKLVEFYLENLKTKINKKT